MNERIRLTKANTPRKTSPVSYRVLSDILNLYINLAKKGSTGARNLNRKLLKDGYTWISEEKISELTGYSIRQVRRAKDQLVEWGYLEPADKRTKFARYIRPHSNPQKSQVSNPDKMSALNPDKMSSFKSSELSETGQNVLQKPDKMSSQSIEVSQETSISSNSYIYGGSEVYFSREILEQVRSQSSGDCSQSTGRKSEEEGAVLQPISSTCFSSQTHSPRKNILEYLSDFERDDFRASNDTPIHPHPKKTIAPQNGSNERIGTLDDIRGEMTEIRRKTSSLTSEDIARLCELGRQEMSLQRSGGTR